MVLVNGAEGIGTGWSSSVPNYNPREIVANLRRLMADEPQQPMHPWYRGYTGQVHTRRHAHATRTPPARHAHATSTPPARHQHTLVPL